MPVSPISGAGYLLKGMRLVMQPGLRRFVLLPLLINILVFSAAIWYGVSQFESFLTWMESRIPSWLHWLDWILWPLFVLVLVILVFYSFTLVANLLASPFNSLLAEEVGFEPTNPYGSTVFKTAAFGRSATPPRHDSASGPAAPESALRRIPKVRPWTNVCQIPSAILN